MTIWQPKKSSTYIVRRIKRHHASGERRYNRSFIRRLIEKFQTQKTTRSYYRTSEDRKWLKPVIFSVVIVVTLCGSFFGSVPFFTVSEVSIVDASDPNGAALKAFTLDKLAEQSFFIQRGHVLRYNNTRIEKEILARFAYPAVDVHRVSLHTVTIAQTLPQRTFLLSTDSEANILDQRGMFLEKKNTDPTYQVALIDVQAPQLTTNEIPPWLANRILEYQNAVGKLFYSEGTMRYEFPEPGLNQLRIVTPRGWYLLVDTNQDGESIASHLSLLLSSEFKKKQPGEYVDLRFDDKVIYK